MRALLMQKLKAHGIDPGGELTEGKLTRAACSCKPTKKGRDGNGWYLFHADEPATLVFGCWNSECLNAESRTLTAKRETTLSPAEHAAIKARVEADRKAREEERQQVEQATREKAARLWAAGKDVSADHDYIKRKGIRPVGIKQCRDMLLIPMSSSGTGEPESLQLIFPDSSKKFLTGTGAIPGPLYHVIRGTNTGPLFVAEGYATACSVHEATGGSVAVAFSSGRLPDVAAVLRGRFPDREIVIAGDTGNGSSKATEAALKIGGKVVFPVMPEGDSGTDWNDVHTTAGLDEVARQLQGAEVVSAVESMQGQGPDAETLSEDTPASTQSEQWPEPLLFGEIDTPELPPALLPEPLAAFCTAVIDSTQTPAGMAVMMALSVVATCIQKRFEVSPFGDSYTEPVNLMTVSALDPASRKSAVVKAMTEPLSAWEMQQSDLFRDQAAKTRHERDMLIKTIETIKTSSSKSGSTDDDRRAALTEIKRLEDSTHQKS